MCKRLAVVTARRAAIGDRRYSSTGILPVLGHGRDGHGTSDTRFANRPHLGLG
jgi:hypothetical protein